MQKTLWLTVLLTVNFFAVFGQTVKRKEFKQAWKNIPANIDECMSRLDVLFSENAKKYFLKTDEETAVAEFNMMQGLAIRNNWKLWKGSALSRYFNSYNVFHPEIMSFFILTSYHRKLNNRPLNFDDQVREYFVRNEKLKTNPPKATDNLTVGDTVFANRFYSGGILRDILGKQPGVEIKAIVQAVDTIAQTFQLDVLQINRTDTKQREAVDHYTFDKQLISKGTVFWTAVTWWRKPSQIIQLHVE